MPRTKKAATAAKPAAKPAAEKKAFIFFNCDAEKSVKSMNIEYNNEVFKDTKTARRQLVAKVKSQIEAGKVQVNGADMETVEKLILEGNPAEASKYLTYGDIQELICY